ncbi:MAG: Smr/MutS family protein, partial [Alphaproteobacteria bacterium]|nr:Smr/MutS family protein [Alphaproteobacteria bacterium]
MASKTDKTGTAGTAEKKPARLSAQDDDAWSAVAATIARRVGGDSPADSLPAVTRPHHSARIEPPVSVRQSTTLAGNNASQRRQLERGKMPIDTRVDLHGKRVESARKELLATFRWMVSQGKRVALVVTGKGTGRLQSGFEAWLREPCFRGLVQDHTFAQPEHGGQGARYVLLRKPERIEARWL